MVNLRLRWVHSLAAAAALASVAASPLVLSKDGDGPLVRSKNVEGPLGLVTITGGGYREARDAGRHAEDALHLFETLTGLPLDTMSRPVARLVLPDYVWGLPDVEAIPSEKGIPWRIEVKGPYAEAAGDVNAHLARLALSLWTGNAGQPLERGDWLAVGLAENLSATQRAHNRHLTLQLAEEGRLPTLETIATWNRMPAGPLMEKAACGLAVGWMLDRPGNKDLMVALVADLKAGRLPSDRLLSLLKEQGIEDPEAAWRAEASRRDVIAGGLRTMSPFLLREFRRSLQTPASAVGLGGIPELPSLSPRQLLAVRKSPAIRAAVQERIGEIQRGVIGAPPELLAVGLQYKAFFEKVPGLTPDFMLRGRLAEADKALRNLEDQLLARTAYVNRFDDDGEGEITPQSDLKRYVDEVEARYEAEAALPSKE
jgi:hypothetical protein